ncbi:hypothetical protein AAFF_G00365770, partial [Aldrovandia affinis]
MTLGEVEGGVESCASLGCCQVFLFPPTAWRGLQGLGQQWPHLQAGSTEANEQSTPLPKVSTTPCGWIDKTYSHHYIWSECPFNKRISENPRTLSELHSFPLSRCGWLLPGPVLLMGSLAMRPIPVPHLDGPSGIKVAYFWRHHLHSHQIIQMHLCKGGPVVSFGKLHRTKPRSTSALAAGSVAIRSNTATID